MIRSGKIILREMSEKDLDLLFDWMQDMELLRLINRTKKTTRESHLAWYQNVKTDASQRIFSIETHANGAFVGQCGLKHIDLDNRKAELWIFIGDRRCRGMGYGQDAVKGLLGHAFDEMGLNRVSAYVVSCNERACRFYERIGFRKEGRFRQDIIVDGQFYDTIHMAILKGEYGESVE